MDNNESLVVFFATCNKCLNAPLFRTLARLHASSAKKQMTQMQYRSSGTVSGLSKVAVVIKSQMVVIASASFKIFFPFDLAKFDRIFNECARYGPLFRAKNVMLLPLC